LQDRIKLLGSVFGEEKIALWKSADVFAFPTFHKEGLPYALLEAMAAGVVPIVTAIGAIPDVLKDEVQGLVVEPHDPEALAAAIARLDRDRALAVRMAEAGKARVLSEYSLPKLAAEFGAMYTQLTETKER
jgi:glycosyltransferase involved in cell wall biosynthesis